MSSGSVTAWIVSLKAGDASAAQPLWDRYFARLAGLARRKLAASPQKLADEEDVALSAFKSLCRGASEGRFPRLADRDDLWPLLVVLASHKATDVLRSEGRVKRGGGNGVPSHTSELESVLSHEPTPEFAALMNDHCEWLLSQLDQGPREVALLKLDGFTNEEVAAKLNCGIRTVERRLELIRRVWSQLTEQQSGQGVIQ